MDSGEACMRPGEFIDSAHPRVREFAAAHAGQGDQCQRAVNLYYAVRDGIYYDPYSFSIRGEDFTASSVLASGRAYCVPKAVCLAGVARAAGIPARIGFADVKNHLASERLLRLMQTDVFHYHGYTEVFLDGRWVKATPAFNIELCDRFGVKPLEFDGRTDSIMHEFDESGRRHMEYLLERGPRDDLPLEEIRAAFRHYYSPMLEELGALPTGARGDMVAEMQAERGQAPPRDA